MVVVETYSNMVTEQTPAREDVSAFTEPGFMDVGAGTVAVKAAGNEVVAASKEAARALDVLDVLTALIVLELKQ